MAIRQKEVIMSQLYTVGRVRNDPELKTSHKGKAYTHVILVERVGFGPYAHKQEIHVWAFDQLAQQLIGASVKKNSAIWVSGYLELADVERRGGTRDKELKLTLRDWGLAPVEVRQARRQEKQAPSSDAESTEGPAVINGEQGALPE